MSSKKIVVVNAGPRKGWNTDTLVTEAAKGAEAAGAVIERFDLFQLEKYTGCVSCFGCKKEKFKAHCIRKDGLTPVLDAIREADGLILGSPNYLSEMTASFRALYERLIFQSLTYNVENPCCNERMIPVLLIMTSKDIPLIVQGCNTDRRWQVKRKRVWDKGEVFTGHHNVGPSRPRARLPVSLLTAQAIRLRLLQ